MAAMNKDEAHFLAAVSQATGIDPRVVAAWMYEEGAFRKGGTGGYNYLNIRPTATDGHTSVSEGNFSQFPDVNASISATIQVLNQPNMRIILQTAQTRPTPAKQISAIHHSPWDKGSYGIGGINLINTFITLFGGNKDNKHPVGGLDDQYLPPSDASAVASTAMSGSAADWTSYDLFNLKHDAGAAASSAVLSVGNPFADLLNWLGSKWERILLVVGGAIIVIIALLLVANSMKSNTFTFERGDS